MDSLSALDTFKSEDLLARLLDLTSKGQRPIVFVLGSALSKPVDRNSGGVPGVDGMIRLVEAALGEGLEQQPGWSSVEKYQQAFAKLAGQKHSEGVQRVVRQAVLQARRRPHSLDGKALKGNDAACEALEEDPEWWIPDGLLAVGKLAACFPEVYGRTLVTSNFDPLLEISLRSAGRKFSQVFGPWESLPAPSMQGDCTVIHFHGFWRSPYTLHSPHQLGEHSPNLKAYLASVLRGCTVVVLGYSGWGDIFTAVARELSARPDADVEVLWCFFEPSSAEVKRRLESLFMPEALVSLRIRPYCGVDANRVLPKLWDLASAIASIPSIHGQHDAGRAISPDPGLPRRLELQELAGFPMEASDFLELPFNPVVLWGLDRSSFVGWVRSESARSVYETVASTEVELYEALQLIPSNLRLSPRWWIRAPLDPAVAPPSTLSELLRLLLAEKSNLLSTLCSDGIPPQTGLGFFFEVRDSVDHSLLTRWTSAVGELAQEADGLAILWHLPATSPPAPSFEVEAARGAASRSLLRFDAIQLLDPVWRPRREDDGFEDAASPEIDSLLSRWTGGTGRPDRPSARSLRVSEVVTELGKIAKGPGDFDQALRRLLRDDPPRFRELLVALARSERWEGRRASLMSAALFDPWLDLWLESLLSDSAIHLEELVAGRPNLSSSLLRSLAFALGRIGRRRPKEPLPQIDFLRWLEADEQRLAERNLDDDELIEVIRESDPHELMALRRLGYSTRPDWEILQFMRLDQTSFWQHMTSLSLNMRADIKVLLQLPMDRRAVFGLCNRREWALLQSDGLSAEYVLAARRNTGFCYHGSCDLNARSRGTAEVP